MLSLGLMSGTSMDGIDSALIETDGKTLVKEIADYSYVYDPEFRTLLKAAEFAVRLSNGNLEIANNSYQQNLNDYLQTEYNLDKEFIQIKIAELTQYFHKNSLTPITLNQIIERSTELHAKTVKELLKKAHIKANQVDVIGYHGQTLLHKPAERITIQVGDGNLLAKLTGITVVNDFRRLDVQLGGQGAPFAPLYHQALAIRNKKIPAAIVNCGGIANITIITGKSLDEVVGFDTGPGNGLIDRYVIYRTQGRELMDKDGMYGLKGQVDEDILDLLYKKAIRPSLGLYLAMRPPKSLDIGDLQLIPELDKLSFEDACATLEAFTADTIVSSTRFFEESIPTHWILSGGGWNNPVIRKELEQRLQRRFSTLIEVISAEKAGWNSRAMEGQIFAYLAVRSLLNLPTSVPGTTNVPEPLCGGKAHLPVKGATAMVAKLLEKNPAILNGYA